MTKGDQKPRPKLVLMCCGVYISLKILTPYAPANSLFNERSSAILLAALMRSRGPFLLLFPYPVHVLFRLGINEVIQTFKFFHFR